MKKILSLTLTLIFVMVAATFALAAETTFEGEFRIRSYSEWNFDKKANDIYDAQFDGWFEQRFRLTITHTRSEYLKAVIRLDLVEDVWGQGRAMRINSFGVNMRMTYGGPGWEGLIDWAYLEFTLPEIGMFRVGKFPVSWGHGLSFSRVSPAPEGAEWTRDWGSVTTTLLYLKIMDGVTEGPDDPDYNRDADFVGLRVAYNPLENHLVEIFGGYLHSYYNDIGFASLAYTGNINDMFDIKAEGGVVFGKVDDDSDNVFGYNLYLDASYYNDMMRVGLAFLLLSSCFDNDNVDNIGSPTFNLWIVHGSGTFQWGNIIGVNIDNIGLYSNLNPYRIIEFMDNLISVKLYFEITPVEKLTINAAVIWASALEEWGRDVYFINITPAGYPTATNSRDLGWEIDFGFSYEIMEGLTYTFSAGVLFTGDMWDYDSDGDIDTTYDREDWGEIWSVVNELRYEF